MYKIFSLLIFVFLCEFSHGQFKQNDTLFFVRDKTDSYYHRIFIDTNRRSEFYSLVSDFTIAKFDIGTYRRSLDYLNAKKLSPKRGITGDFPAEWVMLERYKGKTYVYSPADYYNHYKVKLTDSVFIDWTGEGPEATFIKNFTRLNSSAYQFVLISQSSPHNELTIKYIDKAKGIAIFQRKSYSPYFRKTIIEYQLMGEVRKMKNIPLLINTCDNVKMDELVFDKIKYYSKYFK